MHACPHCNRRGIGFFTKMIANPVYPAVCRLCGQSAIKYAQVTWAQIFTAVASLAVIPSLTSGGTAQVLGTAAAVLVVAIAQIGPMCKA